MAIARLNSPHLVNLSLQWTWGAIPSLFGHASTASTQMLIQRFSGPLTLAKRVSYWPTWRKTRATLSCRRPSEVRNLVCGLSQLPLNKVDGITSASFTEDHERSRRQELLSSWMENLWSK